MQSLSLVDFPGHLASAVFTQGCNFKCPYCHNPRLIGTGAKTGLSEENIFEQIKSRGKMIEGVVITGGEPTIHDGLLGFARRAKQKGLKVKLDTNGSGPDRLKELLASGAIDYVALDIKTAFSRYALVTDDTEHAGAVLESARIIMSSRVPYEFRTTCVPGIVGGKDFRDIGTVLRGAEKYCLQQFRVNGVENEKFRDTRPYTKKDILSFQRILKEHVKKVEMRGV
ncbi:MAG: anaerobic ribonucleoside-triphosphate reductase activating protein, partial [Candidatus Omnitrophota bacterium]